MDDRHAAARDVVRQLSVGEHWLAVAEPPIPAQLLEVITESLRAWDRSDLDWLIANCHPELVIRQVPEIPDSRTYTGPDAFIDALLDWPLQWEDFSMEPRRVLAGDDDEHLIVVALHRGRPHSMDIHVEAEIAFLFRYIDGLLVTWDMFLTVDEALGHAAERRAHGDDDHAAERDGGERAQEAGAEEARADHG
jgi:ketosteroid isomerase-like protein